MRHYCVIPACDEPGKYALTLRLRTPTSNAIAAPNTGAYLCEEHARSGIELDVALKPTSSGRIETYTWAELDGVAGHVERSVTKINQTSREADDRAAQPSKVGRRIDRPSSRR